MKKFSSLEKLEKVGNSESNECNIGFFKIDFYNKKYHFYELLFSFSRKTKESN